MLIARTDELWLEAGQANDFIRYPRTATDIDEAITSDNTVWRLDATGSLLTCSAPTFQCSLSSIPSLVTLPLDPNSIQQAIVWDNILVLRTANGFQFLDTTTGTLLPVPDEVANLDAVNGASVISNQLWLFDSSDESLVIVSPNMSVQTPPVRRLPNGSYEAESSQQAIPATIDDSWDAWRVLVEAGTMRLFTHFAVDETGLYAEGAGGYRQRIGDNGITRTQLTPTPLLDAGWLRWQVGQFILASSGGTVNYNPADFIVAGRLLFEDVRTVLFDDNLYVATPTGIFIHSESNLALNDPNITFIPLALGGQLSAAHSRIISADQQIEFVNGQANQTALNPTHSISIGAIQLTEDMAQRRVSGSVMVDSNAISAFANNGFLWDAGRQGIAFDNDEILIWSAIGLQTTQLAETSFTAPPAIVGQLTSETGRAYFQSDTNWFVREGTLWNAASDPIANRVVIDNDIWQWEFRDGIPQVTLAGVSHAFAYTPSGFTSDQLQAAAADENGLLVLTSAFTERSADVATFENYAAERQMAFPLVRVTSLLLADGSRQIVRYNEAEISRWDWQSNTFTPLSVDPAISRRLVDVNRIRMTVTDSVISMEVRLDAVDGSSVWSPFSLVRGRFPFDVATGLTVFDNTLYVGTAAGLSVYPDASITGIDGLNRLMDLRSNPASIPLAVETMGIPIADSDLFMARSTDQCIERRTNTDFGNCATANLLNARFRYESGFWKWQLNGDELDGIYIGADPALAALDIDYTGGRLPHDRINAAIFCAGQAFTAWDDAWVSAYPDERMSINPAIVTQHFDSTPQRFICLDAIVPLPDNKSLEIGTYLQTEGGFAWMWVDGSWQAIADDDLRNAIIALVDDPLLFDHDQLRVRNISDFSQRNSRNEWLDLPWIQDTFTENWYLPIDAWRDVVYVNNQLWAVTESGFMNLGQQADGVISLNPDRVTIVRELLDCPITDIESTDAETLVRCAGDSNQLYTGNLQVGQDEGVFTPVTLDADTTDPFENTILVSDPLWQIERVAQVNGLPGVLEIRINGTQPTIPITAGYFVFDNLTSVALLRDGLIDVATVAGGWFEISRADVSVAGVRPPANQPEAENVTRIFLSQSGGQQVLCLQIQPDAYIRLTDTLRLVGDGAVDGCPEYQGTDAQWLYERDANQLQMSAPQSISGVATRILSNGRFTDDIITGLPVVAQDAVSTIVYYYVPTQAGVQRLVASNMATDSFYAGVFPANDTFPSVLYSANNEIQFLGDDGLYSLELPRQQLRGLDLSSAGDVLSIGDGSLSTLRVRWTENGTSSWSVFSTDSHFAQTVLVDVSTLSAATTLTAKFNESILEVSIDGQVAQQFNLSSSFNIVDAIFVENQILLVGQSDIYRLHLYKVLP